MCYFNVTIKNKNDVPLKGIAVQISGQQTQQTDINGKAVFRTSLKNGSITIGGHTHAIDHPYTQDVTVRL
ncbi:hypothetical protein H6769_04285 [Candidatus Peribacteria bacterium]|nr:hypothetical protein [Candidatus Peribacteria bacterium]